MTRPPLDGQVAVITGAGSGIGAAAAHAIAAAGAHAILTARSKNPLDEVSEGIRSNGGAADVIAGDLTDASFVDALFDEVERRNGRLDVLVNSAGIFRMPKIEEASPEDLRAHLEINTIAPWACMRRAIALMKAGSDDGRIVNIGSTQALWLFEGDAGIYPATKFALRALTLAVAKQLKTGGSGIRVSIIEPGGTNTPMVNPAGVPLPMLLDPKHVATAVLHAVTAPPEVHVFETTVMAQSFTPW